MGVSPKIGRLTINGVEYDINRFLNLLFNITKLDLMFLL